MVLSKFKKKNELSRAINTYLQEKLEVNNSKGSSAEGVKSKEKDSQIRLIDRKKETKIKERISCSKLEEHNRIQTLSIRGAYISFLRLTKSACIKDKSKSLP